ncbi:hypothetical protein ASD74_04195 [Rhizobium sp. Root564]|nr:hypothetical protein ASD74_04195 [Rhizobium sp. Root564]
MSSVSTRDTIRHNGPIAVFVGLTIIGATTIWFGKLYDLDIVLVTVIPVLLMLAYFALNMLPGLRLLNEQAGDNLYYMGFIFTLTSLGISLFKFTGQASIEDVVRNFGVAIVSTIAGIALRIFFNQMRRDPVDIERAVRHELAEMTRRVRSELDSSAMEFSTYRRTSNQMLSEGFEEIAKQAALNGEAVRSSIEAMSLKATTTIDETATRLMATLEQTRSNLSEIAEKNSTTTADLSSRLEKSMEAVEDKLVALATTLENLQQRYSAAKSPDEVIRIEVSPTVSELKELVSTSTVAIAQNARTTQETAKKIVTALSAFKSTAASLDKLSKEITSSSAADEKASQALGDLLSTIENVAPSLKVAASSSIANGEKIENLTKSIGSILVSLPSRGAVASISPPPAAARTNSDNIAETANETTGHVTVERSTPAAAGDENADDGSKPARSWWRR